MAYNEKLKELSFGEESSKFPNEADVTLDPDINGVVVEDPKEPKDPVDPDLKPPEDPVEPTDPVDPVDPPPADPVDPIDPGNDDDNEDVFKVFASELKGDLFPEISDEVLNSISSVDDIKKVIQQGVTSTIESFKTSYKQDIITNLKNEGLLNNQASTGANPLVYEENDIKDDMDKQKQVIRAYYTEKGIDNAMIDSIITSSIDLEKDSITALGSLKVMASERVAKIEEDNKKNVEAFEKNLIVNIAKEKEFVPGFDLSESKQTEVLNDITNVLSIINADLLTYAPRLSILKAAGILDGDFSQVIAKGETASNTALKELLIKGKNSKPSSQKSGSIEALDLDNSDVKGWYKK